MRKSRTLRPPSLWISNDHAFEDHGAAVLLMVRDGIAIDWERLCRVFRFDRDTRSFHSGHLALKHTVQALIDAGLLTSEESYRGPYRTTDAVSAVVEALSFSLTQAANIPRYSGIGVRPVFGRPTRLDRAPHAFVIMPFDLSMRAVFEGPIKRACRALHLSVERADDIFSTEDVLGDIWAAIVNSLLVIADCTGRNPNVFYELGIAHTVGKPVVLITQSEDDVPTDIVHIRYIKYGSGRAGFRKLETALRKTLKETVDSVWPAHEPVKRASRARPKTNARPRPRTVQG